jgi:hypothetical protein
MLTEQMQMHGLSILGPLTTQVNMQEQGMCTLRAQMRQGDQLVLYQR